MSVEVTVEILGATQTELKELSQKLPSVGNLGFRPKKDSLLFWKWKGFEITGLKDGISEPSAKSENFSLDELTRKGLGELLSAFSTACPRIFSLYAAHGADLPRRESEVQLSELLEVVAEGRLGKQVLYRVRQLPPKIVTTEEAVDTSS